MPDISKNFQKMIAFLPLRRAKAEESEQAIAQRLTPRLWSRTLIERDSFEGRLTELVRKGLNLDPEALRMQALFKETLVEAAEEEAEPLTHDQRHNLLELKYSYIDLEEEEGTALKRLKELIAIANRGELEEEALAWYKDPVELRRLSHLSRAPATPIDRATFNSIFSATSGSLIEGNLEGMVRYLSLVHPELNWRNFESAIEHSQRLGGIIEEGREGAGRAAAENALRQISHEFAERIQRASPGESRLFFASVGQRTPKVLLHDFRNESVTALQKMLFQENSLELAQRLTPQIKLLFQQQEFVQESTIEELRKIFREGVLGYCFPVLQRSLFQDRSACAKILLAPVELLRVGFVKGAATLAEFITDEYCTSFASFLQKEEVSRLYQGYVENRLEEAIQNELARFAEPSLLKARTKIEEQMILLGRALPAASSSILQMLGMGDLGEVEQTFLFEITREERDLYTLRVYGSGKASHLAPSKSEGGVISRQVLVEYRGIKPDKLDEDFFHTLFSYQVVPAWREESNYTLAEFYESLLGSLEGTASDLSNQPEAYSTQIENQTGMFGALYGSLHYRLGWKTTEDEERFLFDLQRRALIDAFHSESRDVNTLKTAAHAFLQFAQNRFRKEKLSSDEMKEIFATIKEMLLVIDPASVSKKKKKPLLVPSGFENALASFLSRVPMHHLQFVESLLISALGVQAERVIRQLKEELPAPAQAVQKPLRFSPTALARSLFELSLGISVEDLVPKNKWAVLRLTIGVARIALSIFFPARYMRPNLILTIGNIARQALSEVAHYFFSDQIQSFYRLQSQVSGYLIGKLLIPLALYTDLSKFIEDWQAILFRSGTISYAISPIEERPIEKRLIHHLPLVPLNNPAMRVHRFAAFLLKTEPITVRNVGEILSRWIERARFIPRQTAPRHLAEQILSLPVPIEGANDDFWSEVSHPMELIDQITQLGLFFYNRLTIPSGQTEIENTIVLYKLYAIVDKLARRFPDAKLERFHPNGWALYEWDKQVNFRLYKKELFEQLEALKCYFGVDDVQAETRKKTVNQDTLFYLEDGRGLEKYPATRTYLEQFLNWGPIKQKFDQTKGLDRIAKVRLLETDPEYRLLLPLPFLRLRLLNFMANNTFGGHNTHAFFDDQLDQTIVIETFRKNLVRDSLALIIPDFLLPEASRFDVVPKTGYYTQHAEGVEHFRGSDNHGYESDIRISKTKVEIIDDLRSGRRKGNEIFNKPRTYLVPDANSQGFFNSIFSRVFSSDDGIPPPLFSKFSQTERIALELAQSNPEEKIPRTVAYFERHIERLPTLEFHLLFRILLLQKNSLYPYLLKHPEFSSSLGAFFKRAIAFHSQEENWNAVLLLVESAILCRAIAKEANCKIEEQFDDYQNLLLRIRKINDLKTSASQLLALKWLFVDPREASVEQTEQAIADLSLSFFYFKRDTHNLLHLFKFQDIFWKWEAAIQHTLNTSERLRNHVLNRVASDFHPGAKYHWTGSYPHFQSGNYSISFEDGFDLNFSVPTEEAKRELHKIFDLPVPELYIAREGGHLTVAGHDIQVHLIQNEGERAHRIQFSTRYKGETYIWIDSEGGSDRETEWMNRDRTSLITLDRKGKLIKERQIRSLGEDRFEVERGERRGEDEVEVDLSRLTHSLSLLSSFQPLSELKGFRRSDMPSVLSRLEYPALNLQFTIIEDEAFGSGILSGLKISKNQDIAAKYPTLATHPRYLVLENSSGAPFILIPKDGLTTKAIAEIGKQAGIESSLFLERLFNTPVLAEEEKDVYLYSLDPKGRLHSSDSDAMLYLFAYSMLENNLIEMRHILSILEDLGAKAPFSDHFFSLATKIILGAIRPQPTEMTPLVLRLGALTEANRAVHHDESINDSNELMAAWLGLQANYYSYFSQVSGTQNSQLNEHQELFLLHGIVTHAQAILKSGSKNIEFSALGYLGGDWIAENLMLHPKLAERYDFLMQKYAPEREKVKWGVKSLFRKLISGEKIGQLSIPLPHAPVGAGKSLLPALLSYAENHKRNSELFSALNFSLFEEIDRTGTLNDLTLSASHLTAAHLRRYLHLYYQLAAGQMPLNGSGQEREAFIQKRAQLRKTLLLIKGRKFQDKTLEAFVFVMQIASTAPLNNIEFPSLSDPLSLSQIKQTELRDKLRIAARTSMSGMIDLNPLLSFAKQHGSFLAQNFIATQLVGSAPTTIALAIRGGHAAITVLSERERLHAARERGHILRNRSLIEERPLSQNKAGELETLDGELSALFDQMVQSHTVEAPRAPIDEEIAPFHSEQDQQIMRKYFERLNESIAEYSREKRRGVPLYLPKSGESFHRLGAELRGGISSLQSYCDQLKREALKLTKQRSEPNPPASQLSRYLREETMTPLDEELYLEALVTAFGKMDEAWMAKETFINEENKERFEQLAYTYLIYTTKLQQFKRALQIWEAASRKQPVSQEHTLVLKQLSFEIGRKRAYRFTLPSERLLRGFLLFEYKTGVMLWEQQVRQVERMLLGPDRRAVLQLLTGSGKTFFALPMLSLYGAQKGAQGIFTVFPESLATQNILETSATARLLGQTVNSLSISRATVLSKTRLWSILQAFQKALILGENFSGRKTDLQALELKFIELFYMHSKLDQIDENALLYFMEILKHLRTKVRGSIDEAHQLFKRNEELNYPLGQKSGMEASQLKVIAECARLIAETEEIARLVAIRSASPTQIDPKLYHREIKPRLADALSRWKLFAIPLEERPQFIRYLCREEREIPRFIAAHPLKKEIGLAIGVLNEILPETLQKQLFVDYGPSKERLEEYAKPYKGNDTPIESAQIKNPFEAALKTALMMLHTGLKQRQIKKFAQKLHILAQIEARKKMIPEERTTIALAFHRWTSFRLEEFSGNELLDSPIGLAINRSSEALLAYCRTVVFPTIYYYARNLRSDSYNFASMFSSFYSDTATPSRDGTFPEQTKILWAEGTTGEFIDFVCTTCTTPRSILEIENERPSEALDEILQRAFLSKEGKASALIDAGALFRGMSNYDVAKRMLHFAHRYRPDIRGIVFFNANKELAVWEVGSPKPVLLKERAISPTHLFTYLGHVERFGADTKQPNGAVGVVTLSGNSTLEDFIQAGGRMRGLKGADQRLQIVVNTSVKKAIVGDRPLTIRDIVLFTQHNEAASQGMENYLAARQKIANLVRRAILDKIIFAPSASEAMKLFKHFKDVLISSNKLNPFELYGYPEEEMTPQNALELYKQSQIKIVENSSYFTSEEIRRLIDDLVPIGKEEASYPDRVVVSPKGAADLGATQEVEQEQEQEQELQQEQEQEQQQQVNTQIGSPLLSLRLEPAKWGKYDFLGSIDWIDEMLSPPSSHPPHKIAHLYPVSTTSPLFGKRMLWTNNYLGILSDGLSLTPLFSPLHKPITELLLVHSTTEEGVELFSIAIDDYEVEEWRKRIESGNGANPKIKFAIFDPTLQAVTHTGRGENRLTEEELFGNPDFCLDLVRWKFLAGHTSIRRGVNPERDKKLFKQAQAWITPERQTFLQSLFRSIYEVIGEEKFVGSDLEFLLEPDSDY